MGVKQKIKFKTTSGMKPMTKEEEYANAGFTEDQIKHIEDNTLSTPLSEYEAIEKLSKDD